MFSNKDNRYLFQMFANFLWIIEECRIFLAKNNLGSSVDYWKREIILK